MNVRTCLASACVLLFSAAGSAQIPTPTFQKRTYGAIGTRFHADFNGDGREDFIITDYDHSLFLIALSTGDGIYGVPVSHPVPRKPTGVVIGDFNQDGNPDVVILSGTNEFYTYYGNGIGGFGDPITTTLPANEVAGTAAAGDFNHDGRTDLAYVNSNGGSGDLHVLFANAVGGWTTGPTTSGVPESGWLFMGDFDGDGKADLLAEDHDMGTSLRVLYGDGAGHFTAKLITDLNRGIYYEVRDADSDGISDLVGSDWVYTTNGQNQQQTMQIIYGHAGRTFTQQVLTFSHCNNGLPAEIADVNGDSIPDLIFVENAVCDGGPSSLVVATRNPDGTYNPEQTIDTVPNAFNVTALRGDGDTKADLALMYYDSTGANATDILLNDTAGGAFPRCAAPNAFRGINVCTPPAGSTNTTTVRLSVGAATQTPGRKIEVWVDGVKKVEQLRQQFSRYAYLDMNFSLPVGNHTATVYAAGFDNLLQKKTFSFNVALGYPGSCPTPSTSTGVSICSPPNGSTEPQAFHVSASGGTAVTFMEVWIDGAKIEQTAGNHVEDNITLADGSHTMTVFGRNSTGVVGKATSIFRVSRDAGSCAQPASATATVICTPQNGWSGSSPVPVQARGGSSVNFMEVWIDGTKRFQTSGNSVSTAVALGAGSHKMTVFSRNGTTVLSNAVSTFTVH